MVLGDAVLILNTFVWMLNHVSRSITWFLFALKASNLVKWLLSKWSFTWRCQFIYRLKFETCHPSSLRNFGMSYFILHLLLPGPASRDLGIISKLIENGMNIARLNFSHGTHEVFLFVAKIRSFATIKETWGSLQSALFCFGIHHAVSI